jgi:Flp pilus assembly pilin Flp
VLKSTLETIANTLGPMFTAAIPSVKELFEYVELGVLKILTAMYRARNAIEDAFADQKNPITMAEVLGAIEHHIDGIVEGTVALIAIGTRMGITLGKAFYDVRDAVIGVKAFLDQGWEAVGTQIVQGIITGITGGISLVTSAITNLGTQIKKAFTDSLGIHSPSKVFEEYGAQTAAGYEAGADRGAPMAQAAADRMAPGAPNGGRQSSAGGGGRSVVVNVHLHGMSEHAVEKAKDASFLEGLTKAIEDALVAAGVGPQSEPT